MPNIEPITLPAFLRASRAKHALLLLLSLSLTAIGVWMVSAGDWKGYFLAIFFGSALILFLVNMLPGASYLRLDERGFTYASLFRAHTMLWTDVRQVGVVSLGVKMMVAFNVRPGYTRNARMLRFSRNVAGYDAALPDSYGMSALALASTMLALRERYAPLSPGELGTVVAGTVDTRFAPVQFQTAEWSAGPQGSERK